MYSINALRPASKLAFQRQFISSLWLSLNRNELWDKISVQCYTKLQRGNQGIILHAVSSVLCIQYDPCIDVSLRA
jgi:hypothetical protein